MNDGKKASLCRRALVWSAVTITAGIVVLMVGFAAVIFGGVYNVAATSQHSSVTAWILHTTALNSIHAHSTDVAVPGLSDQTSVQHGLHLYRTDCVQCHGAPGRASDDFAKGLLPIAPRLEQVGREWQSRDIYWTVAHGIKMTAMPAWEFRLRKQDMWDIVAFLKRLPQLSPAAYAAMAAKSGPSKITAPANEDEEFRVPDAKRGKIALAQYACSSCHNIPGIPGSDALVGPPLSGVGSRQIIAGLLPNTPENMRIWILAPQKIKPGDAMPDMGVSERDATDIVAYLESLH
jgi:mono/diheme cytochrome c family protein